MGLQFVDCQTSQLPQLRAFFERSYSPTYRLAQDVDLLTWQFGGRSGDSQVQFKLAVSGETIQACLGYIPVELSVAGTRVRAAWTANWMVDLSHRRMGLGPLLLRQLTNQFDAVLSLGLDPDACELLPRMGWTDFGDLKRYVWVIDVAQTARLTESGQLDWPASTASVRIDDGPLPARAAFDREVDALWDRVWGERGAGTRRSAEYLQWRYAEHPSFQYRTFVVRRGSAGIHGLAVYRVEQVRDLPVKVGRLVEFVCEPGAERELLQPVIADAAAAGVAMLDFFCSSRGLDAPLLKAGFVPGSSDAAQEIPFLFQPVHRRRLGIRFMAYLGKLANVTAIDDWYVTKADGDQDRPN